MKKFKDEQKFNWTDAEITSALSINAGDPNAAVISLLTPKEDTNTDTITISPSLLKTFEDTEQTVQDLATNCGHDLSGFKLTESNVHRFLHVCGTFVPQTTTTTTTTTTTAAGNNDAAFDVWKPKNCTAQKSKKAVIRY